MSRSGGSMLSETVVGMVSKPSEAVTGFLSMSKALPVR